MPQTLKKQKLDIKKVGTLHERFAWLASFVLQTSLWRLSSIVVHYATIFIHTNWKRNRPEYMTGLLIISEVTFDP